MAENAVGRFTLDEPAGRFTLDESGQTKSGYVADVVRSLPGIIPRAAAGLASLPENLGHLAEAGGRMLGLEPARSMRNLPLLARPGELITRGYDEISKLITGNELYRPQTGPGRIADLTGQMLVAGPGSIAAKTTMGASAGTAGEAARLATDNPLAVGLAQLVGGGVASLPFAARSVPAANINDAIKGLTPSQMSGSQALMDDALRIGAPITGAEAIAQTTGRNSLQDIQRVVEASRQGGPLMLPMMNQRPTANRAAIGDTLDQTASLPMLPSATPVRMQQAADTAITRARQAGNAAAESSYQTARTERIAPQEWNALTQNPAATQALRAVRTDPIWGVSTANEGSVAWLDAAKRWIDDKLRTANPSEARIWGAANDEIKSVADRASSAYRQARSTVADNRQNVVNPMRESPVGDIAATRGLPAEQAMRAQGEILMPKAPRALDPTTIRRTVSTLNGQDPAAASNFVRQNIQAIFDESAQNLTGGANQWGGARFAAQIAGNPAQKQNLQALVESVGGAPTWNGFSRLLDVLEAQGKRQAPGSQTNQNALITGDLSAPGGLGVFSLGASPGRLSTAIYDAYQRFRYGRNTEEMARILTNPRSVELMQQLARELPTSARAAALTGQILALEPVGELSNTSR